MKKILLVFGIMIFLLQPVFGANWIQVDKKRYFDTASLANFNNVFGYFNGRYSFWEKVLNDKSTLFINAEKIAGKKIWYSLQNIVIDCNNKQVALRSYIIYDLSGNVIHSEDFQDMLLQWYNIAPETIGDTYYNWICIPSRSNYF